MPAQKSWVQLRKGFPSKRSLMRPEDDTWRTYRGSENEFDYGTKSCRDTCKTGWRCPAQYMRLCREAAAEATRAPVCASCPHVHPASAPADCSPACMGSYVKKWQCPTEAPRGVLPMWMTYILASEAPHNAVEACTSTYKSTKQKTEDRMYKNVATQCTHTLLLDVYSRCY